MAGCSGIGIKEIGSTKVHLKGTITGLDSSKRYCLHHFWGGWQNLPRSGVSYTYISGKTSFDLSGAGCYVPKDKTVEGQQFEVRCNEIERTCESIIREACTKVLWYEVTEQRYAHFYVRDDNGNPVNNARVEVTGEMKYTGSDGKTYFILDTGTTYYARCYAPDGYECVDCYESFYHDRDTVIDFSMKKDVEPPIPPVPDVLTISAPSTATQHKEFFVDVSGAPISKRIHIYRDTPLFKDKSLGSGVAGGDGKTTIRCITEVSGTIKVYGCYNPGYTKCEIESTRATIEVAKEEAPPVPGEETGILSSVSIPGSAYVGDKLDISCIVKGTSENKIEARCYLIDVDSGEVIDEEPEGKITNRWDDIEYMESMTFNFQEVLGTGKPVMPDHDWRLKIEIWDLVGDVPGIEKSHMIAESEVYTVTHLGMAEGGKFTDVRYPETAAEGDEITIEYDILNPGSKGSELMVGLFRDTGHNAVDMVPIDVEPDFIPKLLGPGESYTGRVTTKWHYGAMPDQDWDLRLVLMEIDFLNYNDRLADFPFTVKIGESVDGHKGDFEIDVPSYVMSGEEFIVKGIHPKPGSKILIRHGKAWASDPIIGEATVNSDGAFEAKCKLEDIGFPEVYAYDPTWLESYFGFIPPGWIPGKGLATSSHRVIVISWLIIIVLLLAIGLVLEKKYGKLGLFKR